MNMDHEETLDRGESRGDELGATIDPSRLHAAHADALERFHVGAHDGSMAVMNGGKQKQKDDPAKDKTDPAKKQDDKKDKTK